jgi:hypothetical protein
MFANTLKESLSIPDDRKLMFGLSFGYVDREDPVNRCATDRAAPDQLIQWHS